MSAEQQRLDMSQSVDLNPSDSVVQEEIKWVMLRRLGEQHPDWQRLPWDAMAAEFGLSSVWQKAKPDAGEPIGIRRH